MLAVVSGDRALAAATAADDLYQPVARRLDVERAVAKVAMLAAMYGQRSGAAGEALAGMERAFPVATTFLDRAYAAGVGRGVLRTYGGGSSASTTRRLARLARRRAGRARPGQQMRCRPPPAGVGTPRAAAMRAMPSSRGRPPGCSRPGRRRCGTRSHPGGWVVLCLHDHLLIHVPEPRAPRRSPPRWSGLPGLLGAALGGHGRGPLRRRDRHRPPVVEAK